MKKSQRVLEAIRAGAGTPGELEADLNFTMTRKRIAGLISYLLRQGHVRKVGRAFIACERRTKAGLVVEYRVAGYRYEAVS